MGDVADFLATSWSARPHLWRDPRGASFDDLLSLDDVDHILATTAPRLPAFRLVRDGKPLDPASYTRGARMGHERYSDVADVAKVYHLFAEGATVVLQSLHRSWAPLTAFCRDLELVLTHPVQANAYLTPAGAAGLSPHHDTHDVFVLQVQGSKHWLVADPVVQAPLARHHSDPKRAQAQNPRGECVLGPGDALYLPRGFVHAARAQQQVSLHITIGVLAYTVHDLLSDVLALAAEEPVFRASLPAGFASSDGPGEGAARAVAYCLGEFRRWLDTVDAEAIASRLRRRFWSSRPPLLAGQLAQLAALDDLGDASVVRRRPRSLAEASSREGRVHLLLGDRELRLPAGCEPALARLLSGRELPVRALDDLLDPPSRLVLVRRLVREGLLEVVPRAGARVDDSRDGTHDRDGASQEV